MTEKTPLDKTQTSNAFTSAVMHKIEYHMSQSELDPFSPEQIAIIEKGVRACQPKTHPVDIRGVLPLHFSQLFYVFLMGRDRRAEKQTTAVDSRQGTKPIARFIFWAIAIWPFYVAAIFGYWILNHMPAFF